MPKVYVVNKGNHNFDAAEKHGELIFMSKGPISKFATAEMGRVFEPYIATSQPEDFLLITSLTVCNVVFASMFAEKYKRLNLLLYTSKGNYKKREIIIGE